MDNDERRLLTSPGIEGVEWVPLQKHPIFSSSGRGSSSSSVAPSAFGMQYNLIAWDEKSLGLYVWDSDKRCLNCLSLRFVDGDPASIETAPSFKILHPDFQMHFSVCNISTNRTGSSILLAGSDGLCVMYLYKRISTKDNITTCRTISVGSNIYFDNNNLIRILQASWHPYSDCHLGILSSDSVLRIFDLSSDLERPEQEFYLQPLKPSRCLSTASICPVAFSFGGDHLWDRFTVFIVFSEGSVYFLCPVVPFGSFFSCASVEEIYKDAHTCGLKSSNSQAVCNSSFAIAWLEATFPELVNRAKEGSSSDVFKARPHVLFDASLALQGPLHKVGHGEEDRGSEDVSAECGGRAVSFLYSTIQKDSILVIAWSSGQLQIDALADELQPVWRVGTSPRICVDSSGQVTGVAMICESILEEFANLDRSHDLVTDTSNTVNTVWLGRPPPLLRLAVVDLALPAHAVTGGLLSIYSDPLVPERIYCLHGGGIDLIMLHFLPFSSHAGEAAKSPSVYPIVNTCHGDTFSPSPLHGFVAVAHEVGNSWIVVITSSYDCIVTEMKGWNMVPSLCLDRVKKSIGFTELSETVTPDILSKELLIGPKVVLTAQALLALRSLAADSIDGRSSLHHYFKLFHENYVEYAHKVYVELQNHAAHLKGILSDHDARLSEVKQMLLNVEEKQMKLDSRINRAAEVHELLEERLRRFQSLPGVNKKPLSKAEREFQSQLERYNGLELDALRSSIEALDARLRRCTQSSQGALNSPRQTSGRRKTHMPNAQMTQLKSALEKLSLVNSENSKKVKIVESALRTSEGRKR